MAVMMIMVMAGVGVGRGRALISNKLDKSGDEKKLN